jgi:prepilin-type N-terminal cleavage/methylation domain-containing protein
MIKDMNRRGFTIVELVIVITIMAILLVISVVNLRGAQANGRDVERKTDIETIALQLENYYTSGNNTTTSVGRYPSTTELIGSETTVLRDLDIKSVEAPGATSSSLIAATNNTQTTGGVTPQPTINTYIYQPLQLDGSLCTTSVQECRKFNLYYMLEVDSTINMVTSRNQ